MRQNIGMDLTWKEMNWNSYIMFSKGTDIQRNE
jgi:hypothetical protein